MKIDNLLYGLKDIMLGVTLASAVFCVFKIRPLLDFVALSFCIVIGIAIIITIRQRQSKKEGDDQ